MSEELINSLVTNREYTDVARWLELRNKGYANMTAAERTEWDAGMKGAYNVSDLNRVGVALNFVRDKFLKAGYLEAAKIDAKTDWAIGDIPTAAELKTYLEYVSIIRETMAQLPTTPETPAYTGGLTYSEANAIEQILVDVNLLITNALAIVWYSGDIYSGEY
jgi:hypothetical protein